VEIGGVLIPTDTPGLLNMLQKLHPPEPTPDGEGEPGTPSTKPARGRIHILRTINNFDQAEFKRRLEPRRLSNASLPAMKTQLKDHQRDGVAWLASSYIVGWPGVLLADDMGLGKTLQSLSFLMLLRREGIIRNGRPALVVAPTSLLRNWQNEHRRHTLDEGLGVPLVAFGTELRRLKIGDAASDGITLLNTVEIANSTWILATYEAIRDYHLSFARIPFSVAILDEMQKAKNPSTRINATLRTLNIEFAIAMTGTPVENSISDLWAITDIVAPGYLPPLKDFMKLYGASADDVERQKALEALSQELLQAAELDGRRITPYALRRLKEDVAKDLPAKHHGPMLRADMPARQAQRYAEVSSATQAGQIKILRALHDFRSISLHPIDPESVDTGLLSGDDYIQLSARLTLAFKKLENIAALDEKVIIFVHNRRMQTLLSRLIQNKFGCPKPEYIRGDTVPGQRQEIVDRFSSLRGFAALVLSPRAAGVGLNIVAANHVIHLDRWWNPAVEDQCTDRAYRIGATKDVFVHTIGAVHPQLRESSYDVVLDQLLRSRRETSKRIFTASDIMAEDFMKILQQAGDRSKANLLTEIDQGGYLGLEEYVRDKLISAGLAANSTYRTGDGGADIVIRGATGQIDYLVQCKFTTNIDLPIDAGLCEDALRMRKNWQAPQAMVVGVTNAKKFAPRVEDLFKQLGGQLINRDDLLQFKLPSAL
jgi:SNF2 family DNA or RNA helicase